MIKNKIILSLFSLITVFGYGQKLTSETLLEENGLSIRAIQIWDSKVWYSGTHSKFGFVSLTDPKVRTQKELSSGDLQFRTLAHNKKYFYTISIESPGLGYQIDKKNLDSKIIFRDENSTAFYDALKFINQDYALALSDPGENQKLNITITRNGGYTWSNCNQCADFPELAKGEAAFAASNSNIANYGKWVWIATGGVKSRIYRMKTKSCSWEVFETPFVQGTSSQGIYSLDFYDEHFGVAVGGDYKNQSANQNNIATTTDGGKTWQIQASGANAGYMTCVKFRPKSKGKDLIAVGDQHISFSSDYGKTWKKISDEKNLYVCEWLDENTLVFAGKNKILRMKIEL